MALDAIMLRALVSELSKTIYGGRIDKVQQPERDMMVFTLRSNGENKKLLIAVGTGNARVHLTKTAFENPSEPPMFCMLMRKHLTGAKILSVGQPNFERLVRIELETFDEMGRVSVKQLIVELIGRSSNLILVGEDGRIIDCLRRMDFAGDELRKLLPGMLYKLPPEQKKKNFFSCDDESLSELIISADKSEPLDSWLLKTFSGLSPLICRELSYLAAERYCNLSAVFHQLRERVLHNDYSPCIIYENGKPRDFSFMPIGQYGSACIIKPESDFSSLLDEYWSDRDRIELLRRRSQEIYRSVKTARDRVLRKLSAQYSELKLSEGREAVRRNAELITANIYRLKKGQSVLECEDYYEPDMPTVRIPLDPLKTPQQNSAALFKQYNKLRGANEHLTVLISQNEAQLDYLNSVLDELVRCETERDFSDIRQELILSGYLKPKKGSKSAKLKVQSPLRFMSDEGFEILVGRSNSQNDELTTKTARRTDIWLHTQKVHGSHVIIRCDGLDPDKQTLEQAAMLAAYYSQGRDSGKIPVDYTMVRNVKKPSGALPGKVNYSEYKTIIVQPDKELVKRLKS